MLKVSKILVAGTDFGKKLVALRPQLAAAAQKVYDEWDASDEVAGDWQVGNGGICHLIAEAMSEVIDQNIPNSSCTTMSHDDQVHVSTITWDQADEEPPEDAEEGEQHYIDIYHVDINPYNYETGGGYTWKKIPDVEFDASWVSIHRDNVKPEDLEYFQNGYYGREGFLGSP